MTRRMFVAGALVAPLVLAACSDDDTGSSATGAGPSETGPSETGLTPTPACDDGDESNETLEQTEGPYFTLDSPEKADFSGDVDQGSPLVLTGTVVDTACRPVARAVVDFWHADADGQYDNDGYRLRGHQFSADDGAYALTTIVPGLYPGRTRHIHVKVQAPDGPLLTTQLYFPDEAGNAGDAIYDSALLMAITRGDPQRASFTFVIRQAATS